MGAVEVDMDQTVGQDEDSLADDGASFEVDSLEVDSLEVDPETPSNRSRTVKVGIAATLFASLGLGVGLGVGSVKSRSNAQSKSASAVSASANGSSNGSSGFGSGVPYDCGGKSGKSKGGSGYTGSFEKVGDGYCLGDFLFPISYDGLGFEFEGVSSVELCESTCSAIGGPGFRGYSFLEGDSEVDCVCHYDDGLVPDCPDKSWSSTPDLWVSFICAKTESGVAVGPISDYTNTPIPGVTPGFGSRATPPAQCFSAVDSYGGKSGKAKGYGHGAGARGKSGKSGLSFFDEGFCRDSKGDNYDAVWFFLAGLVETPPDDEEPNLLGLCEAKCKSPPSWNPNIEYFAAHGLVGADYTNLVVIGDILGSSDVTSFSAESISFSFGEDFEGASNLDGDITKAIQEEIDAFVNAVTAEDGRRLNSKSAKSGSQFDLVVSACFCDYTDDTIDCNAGPVEERDVITIVDSGPLRSVDVNFSGLPYLAISAACWDDGGFVGGQGPVSGTGGIPLGFGCFSNDEFGHFYGGNGHCTYPSNDVCSGYGKAVPVTQENSIGLDPDIVWGIRSFLALATIL
ncbi:hypothetical protein THAOC_34125 [Thalassiosira oceanica]|uniref:WSC domain-containing protein n=1 Tax=Thalassiosira oceanica TaxID=159749 RepID=K0RDS0_THAOC|nr:hypothetical protein THAOC_34125 [Thalassiosira oceanica]|eukprot:EJK47176.1 hypothetical protein THAOC_34125 [Thalassiosira oceanica]